MQNGSFKKLITTFLEPDQNMAAVAFIPDRSDRPTMLHPILYPVLRPDAAPDKCCGQGGAVDGALRIGKDLPVWWSYHSGRRRLQPVKELDEAKERLSNMVTSSR